MSAIFTQFAASIVSIDASMFTNESPVYQAWNIFRNIGNIALAIILIIIIISQLTGFGIDNYGIKKTLPKLIVSVVLMNFSFVACQAIIDLSNILGKGVIGLGHEITNNMDGVGFSGGAESFVAIISSVLGGAAVGAAAVAGEVITIASLAAGIGVGVGEFPIIIVAFILAILPAILALILFFFMLAVRKIGIIACVVVSPLAIVCQVIPGTQSLFKRWIKLFEAMLIVYPICGGLLALSHLVRHIGMSLGGVHIGMIMIGVIAEFSPFFLAPSLIKKSLGGIGNVFNKASSLGKNAIAKGKNSLQNTSAYKNQLEAGKIGMGKKFNDNQMKKRFNKAGLRKRYNDYDELVKKAKGGDEVAKKDLENFARRNRSTISRRDDFMKRQAQLESGAIAAAYGATEDAYNAASREGIFNAENKAMEQDRWNSEFMTGVEMVDEDGIRKEYMYDKATDTFRYGDEIVKRGSDKYNKLYRGMGQNKVKVGDQEYERDGEGWRRTDTHAKATEDERKKIDNELATTSAIRRNYMKGSDGVFRDASGGRELTNESINGIQPQTYSDLKHTEAAQGRQADVWKTAGANAGYSQDDLTRSAAVNAENSAISQTNSTIGKSDAITMMQDVGYSTQTSQVAASQSATKQLINTNSQNVSAGNVAAQPISQLTNEQRIEIYNAAANGNLQQIVTGDYTPAQQAIAKSMIDGGVDYAGIAGGSFGDQAIYRDIHDANAEYVQQQKATVAVTGYTTDQLQQAAANETIRLDNQYISQRENDSIAEVRISHETAQSRAQASHDSTVIRNYTDQFTNRTKGDIETELTSTFSAIASEPGNAELKLKARALTQLASQKGMQKEFYEGAIPLDKTFDSDYLSVLAGMNDGVISEYAKQMLKVDKESDRMTVQEFLTSDNGRNGAKSYREVINDKGQSLISSLNDDALEFLNKKVQIASISGAAGSTVFDAPSTLIPTKQLVKAILGQKNGKIETQLIQAIRSKGEPISVSFADFVEFSDNALDALGDQIDSNKLQEYRDFIDANPNNDIITRLSDKARDMIMRNTSSQVKQESPQKHRISQLFQRKR